MVIKGSRRRNTVKLRLKISGKGYAEGSMGVEKKSELICTAHTTVNLLQKQHFTPKCTE